MSIHLFPRKKRGIYQLKVSLLDVKPVIWRRVRLPGATPLEKVHVVLQMVMGWQDSHLHQFVHGGHRYGEPDPDFPDATLDEHGVLLSDLLQEPQDELLYEYDFGDGWEHRLVLEEILPIESASAQPLCLEGARACPPEDCGGAYGYQRLLRILGRPGHADYRDTLRWLGSEFDPDAFDCDEVNAMLKEYFGEEQTVRV